MSDLTPDQQAQLLDLENNFQRALELHETGQLEAAGELYETILTVVPRHGDTLDLLGRSLIELGEHGRAVAVLTRAIAEIPGSSSPWNHLGVAARAVGDRDTAVKAFKETVALRPDHPDGHLNLAIALCDSGCFEEALESAYIAARLAPEVFVIRLRLGIVLRHLGKHDAALEHLEHAARLNPLAVETYLHISACHGALEEPRARGRAVRRGILAAPGSYEIYTHLGKSAYSEEEGAINWARRATFLRSDEPRMWDHLTSCHHALNCFEEVVSNARRSMILAPNSVIPYNNLATGLFNTGFHERSVWVARAGLYIKPGFAEIEYILCQSAFCSGQPELGWRNWSSRYRMEEAPGRIGLPSIEWRPGEVAKEPVLVCAEQGVGDEILYFSCLPDLLEEAEEVVVECEPRWRAIIERSFPALTVVERQMCDDAVLGLSHAYGEIVAAHGIRSYIFCGTLPELYRRDIELKPPRGGYLVVDGREAGEWKRRLADLGPPPYIGVCWRSGLMLTAQRTMFYPDAVELFGHLSAENRTFISLQYGERGDDLDRVQDQLGIVVNEFADLDQTLELDRVAALMSCLDLVLAPSSTVCHLACSVGVATIAMDKSNFMCVDGRDPLFRNLYPVMRRDEVANPSLAAKRTGEAVDFFLKNARLPRI